MLDTQALIDSCTLLMTTNSPCDTWLTTGGLLLETSYGSLIIDVFGCDFPSTTAQLVNLTRCGFWNGAVANDVVSDAVLFFSHASDRTYDEAVGMLMSEGQKGLPGGAFFRLVSGSPRHGAAQLAAAPVECERYLSGRRCTGVQDGQAVYEKGSGALPRDAMLCRRGTLLVACVPRLPSDAPPPRSSSVLRFGLVLSDRDVSFLKGRVPAGGRRARGAARAGQSAAPEPGPDGEAQVGANPVLAGAPPFPRPVRMIRIHRAVVLPTVGTESYTDIASTYRTGSTRAAGASAQLFVSDGNQTKRCDLLSVLKRCGCFRFWAAASDVAAARTALVRLLRERAAAQRDTPALVTVSSVATSPDDRTRDAMEGGAIEYNAHFTGDYLSSDDDDFADSSGRKRETTREAEQRRQALKDMYQEKANETVRLMLNVLDGVADVKGEIKPPENVLFVCKLNPVTTSEGLALCFSQFGTVVAADVITDKQTKQSLCYGFVEFDTVDACFRAFQKMDKALLDDSRIHVDFSQSVSKLWAQKKREMRKRPRTA
ncbi:RNA-binding protein [Strigomonas culicis]|uniref:Peptidyl-prolyl cis-trans isomerase n=1 Tax=Strigomonas culicis TaxID=28005 RepID=S9VGM2_9TRYP|nr:RNA-binding protein [Strigomonas culicis]|eukprot:EPY26116.1 RNA-binding protein [Strigomonas culicis]